MTTVQHRRGDLPVACRAAELTGRDTERRVLDRLVEAVRAGESQALVVHGEPGVGKTALLEYLRESTPGCRLERAAGVQSEMPGCWVLKPRRIPHTMWNAGSEPARIVELYTPGGFELFFRDFGDRLRQGAVGLEELNRLGEPHGIQFFDDWIPELKAAYNLRIIGE
jgi:hypothetical protein